MQNNTDFSLSTVDNAKDAVTIGNIYNNAITCCNIINIVTEVVKDIAGEDLADNINKSPLTQEAIAGVCASSIISKLTNKTKGA